jgi:MerR family transcriptional regulator, redox-sensitive transcriptional activator SoxR
MTIGEVAKQAGVRASAIRFYEQSGLLPKPPRTSGQRRYDGSILDRLALLEFAKQCGFTLEEVRQLFHNSGAEARLSDRMQNLARKKVEELDAMSRRIALMREFLDKAQRCKCLDVSECGRRILSVSHS